MWGQVRERGGGCGGGKLEGSFLPYRLQTLSIPLAVVRTLGGGGETFFKSFGKAFDGNSSIETQNSIDPDRHPDAQVLVLHGWMHLPAQKI